MLRRMFLILTLALLFGLGQQGTIMHAVSHLADVQEQQQDKKHNAPCEQCVTYAKLANAVPSKTAGVLPQIPTLCALPTETVHAANPLHLYAYPARAPPSVS
jgi:hypothetical protein